MKDKDRVISNLTKGMTAKIWMNNKGWTKQEFSSACEAFVTCGKSISFHDFLSTYEV